MRKLLAGNCCFLALILLWSCREGYQKTESGLQYKIIHEGTGPVAAAGSTVKLHYTQFLNDTLTLTTFDKLPYYKELIPGTIFPYDPFEALIKGIRAGDSVVVIQRLDSLVKKGRLKEIPPHLKAGDVMKIGMRILKVFPFDIRTPVITDSLINADKAEERSKMDSIQNILGPKRVKEYLSKNKIAASETGHGTYVQIVEPGVGIQADSGKTVLLRFSVSNLHGKLIDSNMDTARVKQPLQFVVGRQYMPPSVDRAIMLLKKGGHARIFIPAMIFVNEMKNASEQPAYDDLIFEVKVEEVF